ncbi:MAG: hypothetical protein OXH79_22145 [Boseongicola sp.]|nr:hypothetical protein [Boseongicola sp.]
MDWYYLAKDGVSKLLAPTAEYLGDGLRNLALRRVECIGRIFSNASQKLGDRLEMSGEVPPAVLRAVLSEASYREDQLSVEYFGGVLASSRTEHGRDDRGSRMIKVVDGLTSYQMRTHYLVYSSLSRQFSGSGKRFETAQDRSQMRIFLPAKEYVDSMDFTHDEWFNPQMLHHIWHGLSSDGLIEGEWRFGGAELLRSLFPSAPHDGFVCTPSTLGAELFLWAFGRSDLPLEALCTADIDTVIDGIPSGVSNTVVCNDAVQQRRVQGYEGEGS